MSRISFILGASRSGASLLASSPGAMGDVDVPPETFWVSVAYYLGMAPIVSSFELNVFLKTVLRNSCGIDQRFSESLDPFRWSQLRYRGSYAQLYRQYCQFACARNGAKFGIERPFEHTTYLPQLNCHFPDANGIIIYRNLRDVMASYLNSFGVQGPGIVQSVIDVRVYYWSLRESRLCSAIAIKYEDFTDSPQERLSEIRSFFGLQDSAFSESANLWPSQRVSGIQKNLSGPIIKNSGKYRALPEQLIRNFEATLRDELAFAGYEPDFEEMAESRAFAERVEEGFQSQLVTNHRKNDGQWKTNPYRIPAPTRGRCCAARQTKQRGDCLGIVEQNHVRRWSVGEREPGMGVDRLHRVGAIPCSAMRIGQSLRAE